MGAMLARFRKEYTIGETEKVTYSGRLDPLASGEVLILTAEDVHKKDEFNKHDKTYNFTIMFGASTDTGDILGILKTYTFFEKLFQTKTSALSESRIKRAAKSFIKTYIQTYPPYSSYNIDGIPLWELARAGKLPKKMPKNKVTIYDLEVFRVYTKTSSEILSECKTRVESVDGDFRQVWINEGWGEFLSEDSKNEVQDIDKSDSGSKNKNKEKKFVFADMRVTVSSGTYIRILCEDIGKKLKTPALAYRIIREEIL